MGRYSMRSGSKELQRWKRVMEEVPDSGVTEFKSPNRSEIRWICGSFRICCCLRFGKRQSRWKNWEAEGETGRIGADGASGSSARDRHWAVGL